MRHEQPDMLSFSYEAPFTPARPRKKRKNRAGPSTEQPNHLVALERTRDELRADEWALECHGESPVCPYRICVR